MTHETVVRLAKACPKLKKVHLQGTTSLTDESLLAFFQYCPNLVSLEITGIEHRGSHFLGAAFEALQEEQTWVPILKKLMLPRNENTGFMKAMRALSKEKEGVMVQLFSIGQYKKWGDWELEKSSDTYKTGRKRSWWR